MEDISTNSVEMLQTAANGRENVADGDVVRRLAFVYAWDDPAFKSNPTQKGFFRLSVNIAHDLGISGALNANIIKALTQLGAVRSVTPGGEVSGKVQANPDNPTGTTARGHGFFVPPRVQHSEAGDAGDTVSDVPAVVDETTATAAPEAASKPKRKRERKGIRLKDTADSAPNELAFVDLGEDGQPLVREVGEFAGGAGGSVTINCNFGAAVETAEATTAPPETPKAVEFPEFGSVEYNRMVDIVAGSVVNLAEVVKPEHLVGYSSAITEALRSVWNLTSNETLVAALTYASMGWSVLPWHIRPDKAGKLGKVPLVAAWNDGGASNDPKVLASWFDDGEFFGKGKFQHDQVGIATGETAAGYELVALDVDVKNGKNGFFALSALLEKFGALPATLMQATPSGGFHYLFKVPNGTKIYRTLDAFKALGATLDTLEHEKETDRGGGLDVLGFDGYIGASPSVVDDKPYRWLNDLLPAWLPGSWITALQVECGKDKAHGSKSVPAIDFESNPEPLTDQQKEDVQSVIGSHSRGIKPTVDVDGNQAWFDIGASLKRYGQPGYELWLDASRQSKHWDEVECAETWERFDGSKSIASIFAMADVNPATRRNAEQVVAGEEASKQQVAASLSAASGVDITDKPAHLTMGQPTAEPLPPLEALRTRISEDGATAWEAYEAEGFTVADGGKWLAWGLVQGDESKAITYQKEHPTVTDDKGEQTPRKLAPGGIVDWGNYTYVASMHIAGVVLLMMGKPPGFKATDLGKATQEAVTRLVYDLMDSSPVAAVWKRLNASDPKMILWNKVREGVPNAKVKGKPTTKDVLAVVDKRLAPVVAQWVNMPPAPAVVTPVLGQMPAFFQPGATPSPAPAEETTVTPEPVSSVEEAEKETPVDRLYRLAKRAFRREWVYDPLALSFYAPNGSGAYRRLDKAEVEAEVIRLKDTYKVSVSGFGDITSAIKLLAGHLEHPDWSKAPHLLPFKNTVLDIEKREKLPYELCPKFNWQFGFAFDSAAGCPVFDAFIHKAVGHDAGIVQTLRAFMRCLVAGAYTVKKYLEAVGPSDSGKTQFMNICIALVGKENTTISDLQSLDGSGAARFETRSFYGKRLAVFPDEEKFYGGSRTFRNLTGGDAVRNEGKGVDKGEAFTYEGLIVVTANDFMNPKNAGGAIMKRRIPVMFPTPATPEEMAKHPDGIANYIAANEMPGVMNWVLAMPLEEAKAIMRNPDAKTKALNEKVEHDNDVVLAWLTENVTRCARGDETPVGKDNAKSPAMVVGGYTTGQHPPGYGLYADFCDYCRGVGQSPTKRSQFIKNVESVCKQRNIPYKYAREGNRNLKHKEMIMFGFKLRSGEEPGIFD